MKRFAITLVAIALVLGLAACANQPGTANPALPALTPAQQQELATMESNLLKDTAAAAVGYVQGGKAGAIAGAGAQIVKNHTAAPAPLTAAKNPVKVAP